MFLRVLLLLLLPVLPPAVMAADLQAGHDGMGEMHEDDPLLWLVRAEELEGRAGDAGATLKWDAEAWAGHDLHKFWFKTEGGYADGEADEPEVQFLYSRAIAPWWDLQAGWRHDLGPGPDRDWAVLGLRGTAPYFFETDASLFIGESGRAGLRLKVEYQALLTQRLILSPDLELEIFSKDDPAHGLGSGFSALEAGLRLRYELRREFAPYVGVAWKRRFGDTADFARAAGEPVDDLEAIAGLRLWF